MKEDSGGFSHSVIPTDDQILLGQLLEAVKGLRRDVVHHAVTVARLTARIEEFERLAQRGRGVLIGMGLASMGIGATAHKIVDFFWSS